MYYLFTLGLCQIGEVAMKKIRSVMIVFFLLSVAANIYLVCDVLGWRFGPPLTSRQSLWIVFSLGVICIITYIVDLFTFDVCKNTARGSNENG